MHSYHNACGIYEVQDQDTISIDFLKLKTLFDELFNFESVPNYTCGGLKFMLEYQMRD